MLKIKHGIIYILIFLVVGVPFGQSISAAATPTISSDPQTISRVVREEIESGSEFSLPEQQAQVVEENINQPKNTDAERTRLIKRIGQGKLGDGLWSTFQSFVTSITLISILQIHQAAHEKNLDLTPDNEKKLVDDLGRGWTPATQALSNIPGGSVSLLANISASSIYLAFKRKFFGQDAIGRLFKYFISGALFSIGTSYIEEFITTAAQEVLDHPSQFGGISDEERGALKALQLRAGFFYYMYGYVEDGSKEKDPKEKHHREIFHSIDHKVKDAMIYILNSDDQMRNALFSHLWRRAFLQGNDGLIVGSSLISEIVSKVAIGEIEEGWVGWVEKNSKSLGISIAMGFGAALIPNRVADWGTAHANTQAADLQYKYQMAKLNWVYDDGRGINPAQIDNNINAFLDDEVKSRQTRIAKFAYIMEIAIDRVDTLTKEKQRYVEREVANIQKPKKNLTEIATGIYNGLLQTDVYLEGNPTPETVAYVKDHYAKLFRVIVDADLPAVNSLKVRYDNSDINYYQYLFSVAFKNLIQIYYDDNGLLTKLDRPGLAAATHNRLVAEHTQLAQMVQYFNYLHDTLLERWSKPVQTPGYHQSQQLLSSISFWGMSEAVVMKRFAYKH